MCVEMDPERAFAGKYKPTIAEADGEGSSWSRVLTMGWMVESSGAEVRGKQDLAQD